MMISCSEVIDPFDNKFWKNAGNNSTNCVLSTEHSRNCKNTRDNSYTYRSDAGKWSGMAKIIRQIPQNKKLPKDHRRLEITFLLRPSDSHCPRHVPHVAVSKSEW